MHSLSLFMGPLIRLTAVVSDLHVRRGRARKVRRRALRAGAPGVRHPRRGRGRGRHHHLAGHRPGRRRAGPAATHRGRQRHCNNHGKEQERHVSAQQRRQHAPPGPEPVISMIRAMRFTMYRDSWQSLCSVICKRDEKAKSSCADSVKPTRERRFFAAGHALELVKVLVFDVVEVPNNCGRDIVRTAAVQADEHHARVMPGARNSRFAPPSIVSRNVLQDGVRCQKLRTPKCRVCVRPQ